MCFVCPISDPSTAKINIEPFPWWVRTGPCWLTGPLVCVGALASTRKIKQTDGCTTLQQFLEENPVLERALVMANLLDDLLEGGSSFTFFAPTDRALTAALSITLANVEDQGEFLASLLLYHAVREPQTAAQLLAKGEVETLLGAGVSSCGVNTISLEVGRCDRNSNAKSSNVPKYVTY